MASAYKAALKKSAACPSQWHGLGNNPEPSDNKDHVHQTAKTSVDDNLRHKDTDTSQKEVLERLLEPSACHVAHTALSSTLCKSPPRGITKHAHHAWVPMLRAHDRR